MIQAVIISKNHYPEFLAQTVPDPKVDLTRTLRPSLTRPEPEAQAIPMLLHNLRPKAINRTLTPTLALNHNRAHTLTLRPGPST